MVANNSNVYLAGVITIPSALEITAITNAVQMVVSVSAIAETQENTFQSGQMVKLFVPINYGMFQADGLTGVILSVSGNDLTLDIDSRSFDIFAIPPSGNYLQPASLSPYGSRNLQYDNLTRRVPFQSLNNVGN